MQISVICNNGIIFAVKLILAFYQYFRIKSYHETEETCPGAVVTFRFALNIETMPETSLAAVAVALRPKMLDEEMVAAAETENLTAEAAVSYPVAFPYLVAFGAMAARAAFDFGQCRME